MKTVRAACLARSALLGNPSDGFGGATVSLTVANWRATAEIREAPGIGLRVGAARREWPDWPGLLDDIRSAGHPQPVRLLTATLIRWLEWHGAADIARGPGFRLDVDSDIPLQLGLGGSSAIVIAVWRALDAWFARQVAPELLASLALSVETELLGIPAGLQDRVCQSLEGLVAMDFADGQMRTVAGLRVGQYERLDASLLPAGLFLAWNSQGSEGTEVPHRSLRQRFDAGEPAVRAAMLEFARLARTGVAALRSGDQRELARLIDANFDLRASLCELHPVHVAMIRAARGLGASAQYSGSGGAIIGIVPDDLKWEEFAAAMRVTGCGVIRPDATGRAVRVG
jgi:glucuronokinase